MKRYVALFEKFYTGMSEKHLYWLLFTLFFGGIPLFMRVLIALTHSDKAIDFFVLSDLIFLGLLFNASAMANMASEKLVPTVYRLVVIFATITSLFLVVLYSQDVTSDLSHSAIAWGLAFTLFLSAFCVAYVTAISGDVQQLQDICDEKDLAAALVSPLREQFTSLQNRIQTDDDVDVQQELTKISAMLRAIDNPIRMGWGSQFEDIVRRMKMRQRMRNQTVDSGSIENLGNDNDQVY